MSTQTLSTLTLTCFAAALWVGGNLALGNIAALDYLGVLGSVPWYWRWVVAATPSALQLYLSENWHNDESLLAQGRLFGVGAGVLVLFFDIGGPAFGMLASAGLIAPWNWLYLGVALVPAFICSWWAQEVAWNGLKTLYRAALPASRKAARRVRQGSQAATHRAARRTRRIRVRRRHAHLAPHVQELDVDE